MTPKQHAALEAEMRRRVAENVAKAPPLGPRQQQLIRTAFAAQTNTSQERVA